jgi:hypothetical protein
MRRRFRHVLMIGAVVISVGALLPAASAQDDRAPRIDVQQDRYDRESRRVTLPRGVVEAASAYEIYLRRAVAIRAGFRDGEAIREAMTVGESYQPAQMQEGLIAYAALIALEDEDFVRGVQESARGRYAAARMAETLLANPAEASSIPGAAHAAAIVGAQLRQQGGQLFETGWAIKQSAYDIQHQAWSKRAVPDHRNRLADAKALAASATIPAPEDVERLLQTAAASRGRSTGADAAQASSPAIQRGLALAALALMGEARDEERLAGLLHGGADAGCMRMAKLNLYQCLAVAGPYYEDVFCLGQHALMDTGQCVAASGGEDPGWMGARARRRDFPVAANGYSR